MKFLLGSLVFTLPVLFNVLFARLAKSFDYPNILRKSTDEVLEKFAAGGSKLVLTWWSFAATAMVFAPVSVWIAFEVGGQEEIVAVTASLGVLSGLVQFLGLVRWPFLIPHLARENVGATSSKKETIDLIFQSTNRYLGIAVGEHLGYLFTGLWTLSVAILFLLQAGTGMIFGISGLICGLALAVCSFEFVGKHEIKGWKFAATITPFVYIAWSIWLASLGVWVVIS